MKSSRTCEADNQAITTSDGKAKRRGAEKIIFGIYK